MAKGQTKKSIYTKAELSTNMPADYVTRPGSLFLAQYNIVHISTFRTIAARIPGKCELYPYLWAAAQVSKGWYSSQIESPSLPAIGTSTQRIAIEVAVVY